METIILNELRERFLASRWSGNGKLRLSQDGLDRMKRRLSDLPSETVYYLGDVFSDSSIPDRDDVLGSILMYMLGESEATIHDVEDAAFLYLHSNEAARSAVKATLPKDSSNAIPSPVIRYALDGLRVYNFDGFAYDSNKSLRGQGDHVQRQCVALINIARTLCALGANRGVTAERGPLYIADDRFVKLVADFPDDTSLIESLLEERGADAELIRDVLTAPTRTLSEGVL